MIGFSESSKCAQISKVSDILHNTFGSLFQLVNASMLKNLFETLSHLLFQCSFALFSCLFSLAWFVFCVLSHNILSFMYLVVNTGF
jgi:hypothetical protein